MQKNRAFFLDRDGVINKEVGYLHEIKKFELISGVIPTLNYIQKKGYKIVVITNQSGIGRGLYSEKQFLKLNDWMIGFFKKNKIIISGVFYCPHTPDDKCECRKPKPTLFSNAEEEFSIDMKKSWAIGDKESDILAAKAAGVGNSILVRSGHKINEKNSKSDHIIDSIINVMELNI